MRPQPRPVRPEDICGRCGKTKLGCLLNRRKNPAAWTAIHYARPVVPPDKEAS